MRFLAIIALAGILAACASGPRQPRIPERVINRALQGAPGEAQPSRIVATELAFSRAAREQGQWTAFGQFAADGAVLHGRDGPVTASAFLAGQPDPPMAVQWTPLAVWMSCDGRMALSQGKYAEPGGTWGYYVNVWQQQNDRSYRYAYAMRAPDPVLTKRENRERGGPPELESLIVVEATPMIRGQVADCPAGGKRPAAPQAAIPTTRRQQTTTSTDGTLTWTWMQHADGRRGLHAYIWQDGGWQDAVQFAINREGTLAPR